MRYALILAMAMLVVPACKSHRQPEDVQMMKKQAPDAKPTLHVAEDDPRYVASAGDTSRQVHYYSAKTDTTYVVDESTGKVVRTFKSKEMPGVVVIDKPAYQPPPLKTAPKAESKPAESKPAEGCAPAKDGCTEGCSEKEGCSCGAEVEETETTEIEEVEGCEACEGCEGCEEGCGK